MDQNNFNPGVADNSAPVNAFEPPMAPMDAPLEVKKSNKGLKIGLITGVAVLLAGGIGGGVYAYIHTRPENVLLGAFSNLVNAENLQFSGSILATPAGESDTIQDLRVELGGGSSKTSDVISGATAKITAKIKLEDDTEEISVTTDEVFVRDGVLYLKMSGLKDAVESVIKAAIVTANNSIQTNCINSYASMGLPTTNCASRKVTEADLPAQYKTMLNNIVGTIEGQWWKIGVDEIVALLGSSMTASAQSDLKDAYSCVINQLRTEMNKGSQYVDLFKKNTFATIEKANVKLQAGDAYELKIDSDKALAYLKEAVKIIDIDAFNTCLKSSASVSIDEITKEATKSAPKIYLGISGWNPQIVAVQIQQGDEIVSTAADLKIDYPSKLGYSAPTDAKSVTELVTKFTSLSTMFGF